MIGDSHAAATTVTVVRIGRWWRLLITRMLIPVEISLLLVVVGRAVWLLLRRLMTILAYWFCSGG